MVTVSHIVKRIVDDTPLLVEAMLRDIINYAALAESLQKQVEKELRKEVQLQAIVMALRRHAETLGPKHKRKSFKYEAEIIMKTSLVDLTIVRSPSFFAELKRIYALVNYEKGDTLNIIHGNYEVSMVMNEKYKDSVLKILKKEKILNVETNLVSIAITLNKDFFDTPGIIANFSRHLAWNNVNVAEVVSTFTELTFIIHKKDATKAYEILNEVMESAR